MKTPPTALAIIGSGPSAIYLLRHIANNSDAFAEAIQSITIFEKSKQMGCGMPYSPETTDRYNLSNITSSELPELPETFADWLQNQRDELLEGYGIARESISEDEVYCRLALGGYFQAQFRTLVDSIRSTGIEISELSGTPVADIVDNPEGRFATIVTGSGESRSFGKIVIATGHSWLGEDRPDQGFYASPWPIFKLLPDDDSHIDKKVGTLGASLSAFDVITTLAHRNGEFSNESGKLTYQPASETEAFSLTMHAAEGWLPHLQYEQVEPFREIYRHTDREFLFSLLDASGFLRIDRYFAEVCKPSLIDAFTSDHLQTLAEALRSEDFGLDEFVERMESEHEYIDSFEGMRREMTEAEEDAKNHRPAHWKEVLDDLMFTMNYHAELMSAEDHIRFRKTVMPFLMNVIAAIPIKSARIMLALHDAGKLEMVAGYVDIDKGSQPKGITRVSVETDGKTTQHEYEMFVDCSGQKGMELEDYPFPSLVLDGSVRSGRAKFSEAAARRETEDERIIEENGEFFYATGGIDIDSCYRVVGEDGTPNPRIQDIAMSHASGIRPYSYGLQACDCTAEILVDAWLEEIENQKPFSGSIEEVADIYEAIS